MQGTAGEIEDHWWNNVLLQALGFMATVAVLTLAIGVVLHP